MSPSRGAPGAPVFARAVDDYARHRAGFPAAFFERLLAAGWVRTSDRLLDLGTGTGSVARGFARRGLEVVGLDVGPGLLSAAQELDREAEVEIPYVAALAEAVPFRPATFDVVTAGQCWHWFDRARAAHEVYTRLRKGGRVVLAHLDWLPLPGNVVAATETLIRKHNPAWNFDGGTGLYPHYLPELQRQGFTGLETFSFDLDITYSHPAWRGRIRASAGIGASLDPIAVANFDAAHAALLDEHFPTDPLPIPHRVWAVVAKRSHD